MTNNISMVMVFKSVLILLRQWLKLWCRGELRTVAAAARVMGMRQRSESVCEEQKGSGGGEEARG